MFKTNLLLLILACSAGCACARLGEPRALWSIAKITKSTPQLAAAVRSVEQAVARAAAQVRSQAAAAEAAAAEAAAESSLINLGSVVGTAYDPVARTRHYMAAGYRVADSTAAGGDCVVTLTAADTGLWRAHTNVLLITSDAQLRALAAGLENCAAGWRLVGGGLMLEKADDVANLDALRGLRAIEGQDSEGHSLSITNAARLGSLSGLRNLAGALPGALVVHNAPQLASLSGLEGITRVDGPIRVDANAALASLAGLRHVRGTKVMMAACERVSECPADAVSVPTFSKNPYDNNPALPWNWWTQLEGITWKP